MRRRTGKRSAILALGGRKRRRNRKLLRGCCFVLAGGPDEGLVSVFSHSFGIRNLDRAIREGRLQWRRFRTGSLANRLMRIVISVGPLFYGDNAVGIVGLMAYRPRPTLSKW